MARRSKRNRPSSPAEILARNALQRGQKAVQQRRIRGAPQLWGIAEGIELLPANEDLEVARDPSRRDKILRARRSDAFNLVNLTDDQHRASDRYVRDCLIRARVQVDGDDPLRMVVVDGSPGLAPGQFVNQRMIDAGRRIEAVHRLVGPVAARLLEALVEPITRGQVSVWRVLVQRATGMTERHEQAAAVKLACQGLHESWPAIDEAEKARREERAEIAKRADEIEAARVRLVSPYAGGGEAG